MSGRLQPPAPQAVTGALTPKFIWGMNEQSGVKFYDCPLGGAVASRSTNGLLPSFCCSPSGENPLPPDDPNKELMGKTEVSLTLANKFDVPGEANVEMDAKTLLLK